jgi:hypothetical protein
LPRFLFLFVVEVGIIVVVFTVGVLVKLFIFKDFVVFVVGTWAGIHAGPAQKITRRRVEQVQPVQQFWLVRLVVEQARRVQLLPRRAVSGTWSNNAGRTAGTPRTG